MRPKTTPRPTLRSLYKRADKVRSKLPPHALERLGRIHILRPLIVQLQDQLTREADEAYFNVLLIEYGDDEKAARAAYNAACGHGGHWGVGNQRRIR